MGLIWPVIRVASRVTTTPAVAALQGKCHVTPGGTLTVTVTVLSPREYMIQRQNLA
uniref:Uncharacterized protein n=1 Tax=Arion vulgaris TaxID=1028688 RepID=A0A0B6ZWQ6_9EUPU